MSAFSMICPILVSVAMQKFLGERMRTNLIPIIAWQAGGSNAIPPARQLVLLAAHIAQLHRGCRGA
jgi:hypothetical protein